MEVNGLTYATVSLCFSVIGGVLLKKIFISYFV